MAWFKRIGLFMLTNMAVMLLLTIVIRLLGVDQYMIRQGQNYQALLLFAAVFGMGGSLISLAISKWMAIRSMGCQVIKTPSNATEVWLVDTVTRLAREARIGMPDVAIYGGHEINAFATGMSKNNALVAVSSGLLQQMDRREAEAVLAHEISHVANGDMVTLTLIQGVVNTFVIFFARIIGSIVDRALSGGNEERSGGGIGYFIAVMVAEIFLGIFASMIVMWFSRWREFRADAGGAQLAGRQAMIAALERLRQAHEPAVMPNELRAFGISGGGGMMRLFMSHPPLEERIEALRRLS
jgi:heat shock protein HtpX